MAANSRTIIKIVLLIVVPWVFLIFSAPLYNRKDPELFGWPFLWWYLFLWVFIQPALTYIVYKFIDRGGEV
ncbi:hypothetical protein TUZN_0200 [Thermoproteus uzoniensis 768-20]|uniref:DUF3311 domain-containing protein n=1 Tax=Thermoproteus uzoniensis (strain 768-20) TaxID=999630 RepID=F2L1V9_THEU7|nr:DUF3311 domain-containing protein [Thermoproteus uzoniensis]AEA11700.1 hypothetical protein TUZN_0200 [Thermoproteus uzoniensis 768-20]